MALVFWKRTTFKVTDAAWPKRLALLKERLSTTTTDDTLMDGIMGLIDANIRAELDPATTAGLGNEEAHRMRGRLGMLLDLKRELETLWRACREKS